MKRSAVFSPDRSKRFELTRDWSDGQPVRLVNFIMLNPSDAGEEKDDMTVRKGVGFATRWGYNALAFTNLRADVSTDPWGLTPFRGIDLDNNGVLNKWAEQADLLVAAWGSQPRAIERRIELPELIYNLRSLISPACLYCIGENGRGAPLHPSRAAYTSAPVLWREAL